MKYLAAPAACAALAVSACGPTVGGGPNYSTISSPPPVDFTSMLSAGQLSDSGYGTGNTAVLNTSTPDGSTYHAQAKTIAVMQNGNFSSTVNGVNLSWWNAPTSLRLDYKGESIILTDQGRLNFMGSSPNFPNGISILFRDAASASGGTKAILYELSGVATGSTPASGSGDLGLLVFGASSDPSLMPTTGGATYDKGAGAAPNAMIRVVHQGSSSAGFGSASGDATLNATFTSPGGSVTGTIANFQDTSGAGSLYAIDPNTSFSVNGTISGNSFSGTTTVNDVANIGMSSESANTFNGYFFGEVLLGAPTNIGGYFGVTGTSAVNTGSSAELYGAFIGE